MLMTGWGNAFETINIVQVSSNSPIQYLELYTDKMAAIKSQNTALITGAASGVGFATAKLCRKQGMHLALLDINAENLQKAKAELAELDPGLKTEAYVLDVADRAKWDEIVEQVSSVFGGVDLVMLNAGASYKPQSQQEGRLKPWSDVDYWKRTFDTNTIGLLNGIAATLPLLHSTTTPKSIVLTGSKQGITNPPGGNNPAYNASKAAVKNLAEHLAHDLRSEPASSHISVHLLVPGWTWTGFMGNAGTTAESEVKKMDGAWFPSQVAEELFKGLKKEAFYIICPDDDVDVALDNARMHWASQDVIEGRPALSRWEESWKSKADEEIKADAARRRG
ncbi:SDR family NAD(P)-dependent oxidoreductase [Aspergillus melleus]|uniref:SDR family NAD(P)-dependent oxidoreductase n=1 Tax=Aspergillus melleus TaxID=138277 RepID=UPI001E8E4388|nr:uncharacterized protein LDX57_008244 [Aspergillus melleus]KAH8430580.1 hypothetical protein LDX57_008244 [Aspergillus melleus]